MISRNVQTIFFSKCIEKQQADLISLKIHLSHKNMEENS